MVMTEVFNKLKELQDVLAKKYELEQKIEESPKQLGSQDELLARLKKEYIEKNAAYEEIKAKVEKLKVELAEAEASRESGEKGMDNITTHREYEALDKQINEATERENAVRKDLQKEEKNLNELQSVLQADEEMIKGQEADLNAGKENLEQEINGYKNELAELESRENEIVPGLDQEIVYKFQRIIKRNSEGIVAVRNGVCTGCHMILPAQFANEVHDGEKILFCPYCSRILFHEDVADEEVQDFQALGETGSLADLSDYFDSEGDDADDALDEGHEEGIDGSDDDDRSSHFESSEE